MDLKEESILGDSIGEHWYYRSKADAVLKCLGGYSPNKVLDIGAGSGFFSKALLKHTNAAVAVCVDTSYSDEFEERVNSKPIFYCRDYDVKDADLALLMDVLEHVDDDLKLLAETVANLPRGAQVLVTVPAFQFLWSGHDIFLEHKRRYTIRSLERLATGAGLDIQHTSYFFGFVFPLVAIMRLLGNMFGNQKAPESQLKKHSKLTNLILYTLCRLESFIFSLNRVAGLSIFCLATKP
jgi:SAM-dependent methyltransferase